MLLIWYTINRSYFVVHSSFTLKKKTKSPHIARTMFTYRKPTTTTKKKEYNWWKTEQNKKKVSPIKIEVENWLKIMYDACEKHLLLSITFDRFHGWQQWKQQQQQQCIIYWILVKDVWLMKNKYISIDRQKNIHLPLNSSSSTVVCLLFWLGFLVLFCIFSIAPRYTMYVFTSLLPSLLFFVFLTAGCCLLFDYILFRSITCTT